MRRRLSFLPLLSVLLVGCLETPPTAVRQLAARNGAARDLTPSATVFVDDLVEPAGVFSGVPYVVHTGRFVGTVPGAVGPQPYRVPYEITTPADPAQGNGRVVVEPSHFVIRLVFRDGIFGPEFLFGRGFTHAGLGWSPNNWSILVKAPDVVLPAGVPLANGTRIIADFANALRAGALPTLPAFSRVYAVGYSQSSAPVILLAQDRTRPGLFDLTFTTRYSGAQFTPFVSSTRSVLMQTENELIVWGKVTRPAVGLPNYRLYEVAGASHVPDNPFFEGAVAGTAGSNPLDWTMIARSLFVRADQWITDGAEPPAGVTMTDAPAGEIDPVYGTITGIARDANLNALGGIRLPEVALGRAQFKVAVKQAPGLPFYLIGAYLDLKCVPLPDGSVRFPTHGGYVSAFRDVSRDLVRSGYLLQEDAATLGTGAAQGDVGKPQTCEP